MAYLSAHLDEAASELVVPSGHNSYAHPDSIAEIKRVLYEDLAERTQRPQ